MPVLDYAALRQRIAMRRVLELIQYQPTVIRGDQWRGPCPLPEHTDARRRHRCFSVHLIRNAFRCFRCGETGNQLDLWATLTRQSLYPASIDLCQQLRMEVPWLPEIRNSDSDRC